jgi:hypothetical protein
MSRTLERDSSMHGSHHKCSVCLTEFGKYIWKDKHWCRVCIDNAQYPELIHLTQAEREERRIYYSTHMDKKNSFVNTGNLDKKEESMESSVGF